MATDLKLTDAKIETLPVPATGYVLYRDRECAGLAVRVTEAGGRAFTFEYRTTAGKRRRMTLGDWSGDFGIIQARAKAAALAVEAAAGKDPLGDQALARLAYSARPTVAKLFDDFIHEHAIPNDRPSTVVEYRSIWRAHIAPVLTDRAVADVTRGDIAVLINAIKREHPARSNRVRALLSVMFNHAIRVRDWREANPVAAVKPYREEPRRRYLSDDEFRRLNAALDQCANQQSANAVRLLYWTDARCGETLAATWDEFDLERGEWTKPSHRTKQKTSHTIPLHPQALALLLAMQGRVRPSERHLFPGECGQPLRDLKTMWATLMRRAQIENVRLHDLRHTFASRLLAQGVGLEVIGGLLGHTRPETTYRYAHLAADTMRSALERPPAPEAGNAMTGAAK